MRTQTRMSRRSLRPEPICVLSSRTNLALLAFPLLGELQLQLVLQLTRTTGLDIYLLPV